MKRAIRRACFYRRGLSSPPPPPREAGGGAQGWVSVFNGLLHFVRNDMGKKRAKFPSGGGVARSAGVVFSLSLRGNGYRPAPV